MIWNEPHLCLKAKLKKENLHLAFNILVSRSRANEICLFDEIWIVVFKYLSYLNLIMMSRTCKKFFTMVNGLSRFKNYEKHMNQVFTLKTKYMFFANFRSDFQIFFLNHFSGYANYLHMKWFLSIILEQLNERVLFAHVYFCRRNSNDPFSCQYCRPVPRCKIFDNSEHRTVSYYSLITYGRWDENFIQIFENEDFYSPELNRSYKSCPSRDFIWCYNQLLNYFGKIAVKIFLNIGKKHLFFRDLIKNIFMTATLKTQEFYFQV